MTAEEIGGRERVRQLFAHYRKERDGIRNSPEMGSICLICGSIHVVPKGGVRYQFICRDCGFAFFRYDCDVCGNTVDGRDPLNPGCAGCGRRICTCGACDCPTVCNHT